MGKTHDKVAEIFRRSPTSSSGVAVVDFQSIEDSEEYVHASPSSENFTVSILNPEALVPLKRHSVRSVQNELSSDESVDIEDAH